MRKLVIALTVLAGLAAPMVSAHAGMCWTNCIPAAGGGQYCTTMCP